MRRIIGIATAAVFGIGSALLALPTAAQATQITHDCDIPAVGPTEVHVNIETTLPDTAEPNESLPFDVDLTVTLPPEVATVLYNEGARTAAGSADEEFEIAAPTNSTYPLVTDITFTDSTLMEGEALELSGTGTADSITSLGEGDLNVYADSLDVDLSLHNGQGDVVPFEPFSCSGPPSDSASLVHTVVVEQYEPEPVPTTTTLEISEPVVDWGGFDNEFTATVDADGEPVEGYFEFFVGGWSMGDPERAVDGMATFELTDSSMRAGSHQVRAVFSPFNAEEYGDSTHSAFFTVHADTETALEMTETEFEQGADVQAIATTTTIPTEAGDPFGDVLFEIDGLPAGEDRGSPAVWDLPTDEMPPGEYTLIATFVGDEAFGQSVSETINFTILPGGNA